MIQPVLSERNFLGEGLQEIIDTSLNWLGPALTHMLKATRQVSGEKARISLSSSSVLNPAQLEEGISDHVWSLEEIAELTDHIKI